MPRKLLEALLPVPQNAGSIIEVRLPAGTMVVKFGYTMEKSAVVAPGPNGAAVTIKPKLLCVGDPRSTQLETHRFMLVAGSEDIPDDARFVDLIMLPDGVAIHLFEVGQPTPFLKLVETPAAPAA